MTGGRESEPSTRRHDVQTGGRSRPTNRGVGSKPSAMRRPLRCKSTRVWCLSGVTVVLVIAVCIAVAQVILAQEHLIDAADHLESALAVTRSEKGIGQSASRDALTQDLKASHRDFSAAESDLWFWNPVLGHLGWVPNYGREIMAAYPVAAAGEHITAGALNLLDGLSPVWKVFELPGKQSVTARLAPRLALGEGDFVAAGQDLATASAELRSVSSDLGSASRDRLLARLRRAVTVLRTAARWLRVSPTVLGNRARNTILLAWENPDQIRPVGGFIAAATYLTLTDGRLHTRSFGSFFKPSIAIPVPAPEGAYTGEGSLLFEDSNWSPDFPLSARYERWMFGIATGLRAQMVVDVTGAGAILSASGPVYVKQYRRWVNASNAAHWIEFYHLQYVHGSGHDELAHSNPTKADTESQRFLSDLFADIMAKIQHLRGPGLVRLASGFERAIAEQTILMYDRRPSVEGAIQLSGADGGIGPVDHDSLLVVDDNLSYNKINPYISERASYDVFISRQLQARAVLRMRYHNRKSPGDLYGNGPFDARRAKHTYQDFVRVYAPPGATLSSGSGFANCPGQGQGVRFCSDTQAYGMTEFSAGFEVPEYQSQQGVWRYWLPRGIFGSTGSNRYELTLRRQPSANLSSVVVRIHVAPGMTVGTAGGHMITKIVRLREAATTISVPISGALGSVQPLTLMHGPWSDPWLPNSLFNTPFDQF
jgi:hypothetical protein